MTHNAMGNGWSPITPHVHVTIENMHNYVRVKHIYMNIRGVGRNSQGGFQQRINARVTRAQGRFGGIYNPGKLLDFRPFKIVSDAFSEYRASILQIMQTARLALVA